MTGTRKAERLPSLNFGALWLSVPLLPQQYAAFVHPQPHTTLLTKANVVPVLQMPDETMDVDGALNGVSSTHDTHHSLTDAHVNQGMHLYSSLSLQEAWSHLTPSSSYSYTDGPGQFSGDPGQGSCAHRRQGCLGIPRQRNCDARGFGALFSCR